MRERKSVKPPEKPDKIEAALRDPEKRKHLGPCCVTSDGSICGTKKWGDGKGFQYKDSKDERRVLRGPDTTGVVFRQWVNPDVIFNV